MITGGTAILGNSQIGKWSKYSWPIPAMLMCQSALGLPHDFADELTAGYGPQCRRACSIPVRAMNKSSQPQLKLSETGFPRVFTWFSIASHGNLTHPHILAQRQLIDVLLRHQIFSAGQNLTQLHLRTRSWKIPATDNTGHPWILGP